MGREANPKMILIDFLEMFNVRPGALSKIYLQKVEILLPYTPHHFENKCMSILISCKIRISRMHHSAAWPSFSCLSAVLFVYFPVQCKFSVQGNPTQSCPLSTHRTTIVPSSLKFMSYLPNYTTLLFIINAILKIFIRIH